MGEAALAREFAQRPPREELDSLAALWRDYMWRYVKAKRGDPCVTWTKKAPDLHEAIRRACSSMGEDGKTFFHQGRVWKVNRIALCKAMWEEDVQFHIEAALEREAFWEVYIIIKQLGVKGIGAVTLYDVTSRVCAWAGVEPEHLYVHAGVAAGAKALGLKVPRGAFCIDRAKLPKVLRKQNLDLVESFLCGYRSEIERVMKDAA